MVDMSEIKSYENHEVPSLVDTTRSGVASWTAEDVQKWLEERQLKNLENLYVLFLSFIYRPINDIRLSFKFVI